MEENIDTLSRKDGKSSPVDNASVVSKTNVVTALVKSKGAKKHNTARITATIIGTFAGITGASHGVGEILQGNVAPSGIVIKAWPTLTEIAGEPAMTVVPNFLLSGILTLVFGFVVALWAIKYIRWTHGGFILILLTIGMLLVGGGFAPPIFGILAGLIGMRVNYELSSKKHFMLNLLTILAVPVGILLVILFT